MKRKGRNILRGHSGSIRIEPYAKGDYLETPGFFITKLTPTVARRLIAELQPYTEWLPPDIDRRTLPKR